MRVPQWAVLAWVIVIAVVAVGGSYLTYHFVRDRVAEADVLLELPDLPQIGDHAPAGQAPQASPTADAAAASAATPAPGTAQGTEAVPPPGEDGAPVTAAGQPAAPEPWRDPRRVTILLLGIDQRQGEQGPFPTDTIMLLSLDPVGKTAAILSIPRDLWVDFPGAPPGRINTANIIGDNLNYPGGGGPALAARTIERTLGGVRIDFYVLINFEVFNKVIDTIGPIEVCPPEPIDDNKYPDGSYGFITIHFDAGCQELGSERLLQYARTRHGDSDIGRSTRQQEVILAVREKVLSAGGVMALLPQAPALWESVQANIRTNLTFDDMVSLALTAEEIPPENIRQGQIGFGEVTTSTTPDGEQVLVPIWSDIRQLLDDLFRPAGTASAAAP